MKRAFQFAFFLILGVVLFGLVSYMSPAYGQGRGDKRPAYQLVRDSSITQILIDPTFLAEIVLKSDDGNAPLADSAIKLRLGGLTTGHFTSASLDSFIKLIVDTSDYARFVRNGAIISRSAFSTAFLDSLQGDADNYLILYARNARRADSSTYSDYADEAGTANYAIKYIGTDTLPAARFANTASYASVAGSALSQQGYFTASQWDSIYDSTNVWIGLVDSVVYAKTTDSLTNSAIDKLAAFNSTVQDSYLVTKTLRQALNRTYAGIGRGAGDVLSGTNPPIDSTGASKNFARKYSGVLTEVGFSDGVPGAGAIVADTANTKLRYKDGSGDAAVFPDSAAIATMINTASDIDSADYIVSGLGSTPDVLQVGTSGPATNLGNMWVDTTAVTSAIVKVRTTSGWVSASGAAGTPTDVSLGRYGGSVTMDGDSFVVRSRPDTIIAPLRHTDIYTNTDTLLVSGRLLVDSLRGESGVITVSDSLHSTTLNRFMIGSAYTSAKRPIGFFNTLYIGGASNALVELAESGTINFRGNILPGSTTGVYNIGRLESGDFAHGSTKAFYDISGYSLNAYDTVFVGGSKSASSGVAFLTRTGGLILKSLPLSTSASSVSFSNSTIQLSGTSNLTWGTSELASSGNIVLGTGRSLTAASTGGVYINSGATLYLPSDSSESMASSADVAQKYFPVTRDEKNALRRPCPDISASNYVISKDWMKRFWTDRFWNTSKFESRKDSLRYYYWQFKQPTCNDSLVLDPNDHNSEIVWPTIEGTPIEWPDTAQALILPWITPGLPVGPYWIDSTADGAYYADPVPGLPEGILKVDQRSNDTLAYITGRYSTIKAALDSLVNFRCAVGADCTRGSEAGELDTFYVSTKSATISKQLSMYRGSVLVQDSIRQVLPDFITESGAWVKFEKASESAQMWIQIECWINDSIFTVRDSVLRAATVDNTWTLTFAKKQTILVYPPVDGQYINLPATCVIGDYCPVKIKGVDKNSVVITNKDRDPTPSVSQMFKVSGSGANDTYLGMPIEFEDLTIYYETTAAVVPANVLSGFLKFTNCNLLVKTDGTTANSFIQFNYYDAATISERARPTFIVDNCVVVADSDVTVFEVAADSVLFQSSNSSYSVSGDNGMVLYFSDKWGEETPRFSRDEFFFGLSGTYTTPQGKLIETNQNPAGSTEKVKAPSCVFIGLDPATPSNLLTYPSGSPNFLYSSTFAYSIDDTKPPAKLRDGLIPVKPPWSPK